MEGAPMRSTKWCYYTNPQSRVPEVLKVAIPITKKQAIFILKKKLHIPKIYYIISCNEI